MHALLCHRGGGIECWEKLGKLQEHIPHLAFEVCLMFLLFGKLGGELFHLFLEVIMIGVELLIDVPNFSGGFCGEVCHVLIHHSDFMLRGLHVHLYHLPHLSLDSGENVVLKVDMRGSSCTGLTCVLAVFGVVKGVGVLGFLGLGS